MYLLMPRRRAEGSGVEVRGGRGRRTVGTAGAVRGAGAVAFASHLGC